MQNVVSINNKQKKQDNLRSYPRKGMHCPVTDKMVMAYGIPLEHIATTTLNPGRVNDCPENNIREIADSFDTSGQVHPIMVSWSTDTSKWDVKFGCNRTRAMTLLLDGNSPDPVPYSEGNRIWANVFSGSPAELNKLKTIENFKSKLPGVSGTQPDLVDLLNEAIILGALKADRQDVKEHVKEYAPSYAGRKFPGLWNKLQKTATTLQKKFKTWDKPELAKFFGAHNKIGHNTNGKDVSSGHVVKFKDRQIAIYYVTQNREINGALPTNASNKKFDPKNKVDKVWLVVAINSATSGTIDDHRNKFIKDIKRWNSHVAKSFDKVLYVPQSESEIKQGMVVSGQYALAEAKL